METPTTTPPARRGSRVLKSLAFVALGIAVGAAAATGVAAHGGSWRHGADWSDPSQHEAHIERFLKHLYVEIDATDAQKAQIDPIVRRAADELGPLHNRFRSAHGQLLTLLGQDSIDRAAIETVRAQHLQMADDASRTLVKLAADVADALTPAQRKLLIERITEHHGRHHG